MGSTWDDLVLAICRPPRDAYTPADLVGGTAGRFTANGRAYTREDFAVRNPRGHLIQLSLYEPAAATPSPTRTWGGGGARLGGGHSPDRGPPGVGGGAGAAAAAATPPVVVYCHCNSGSRRDAEEVLHLLLPRGLAVLALDFAGSGVSEGDFVTLGAHEVDDLAAAIGALRSRRGGARLAVGLWGRSMGAATALLYAARDPRVAALVLDSPFASLPDLMADLAGARRLPLPRALTRAALALMRRSVSRRAGFDVSAVLPASAARACFAPALFGAAPGDDFIPIAHTRRLVACYAGDAACVEFEGGHNSVRPGGWYASGLAFLAAVLLGGEGGVGGAAASAAAAAASTRTTPPPPPRPFASRGGCLPVADPADLAAAAAFEGSVVRAGGAPGGHPYGGAALAAAHAGGGAGAPGRAAEGAAAHRRRGGAGAGLTPADLFPPALVGGGRSPSQAEAAMLAAALADSLAVSGGGGGGGPSPTPPHLAAAARRRSPSPGRRACPPGRASPPPPARAAARPPGRPRDPGEAFWPPAGPAGSPAPSTAAATASGTPSPARSHFTVPTTAAAAHASPGGGPTSPAPHWPTPPSGRKVPPAAVHPSPSLTPDQARLASFFGAAKTMPGGRSPGGAAVIPIEAASPRGGQVASPSPPPRRPPASSERVARYAAGAGADAARAARRNSAGGGWEG